MSIIASTLSFIFLDSRLRSVFKNFPWSRCFWGMWDFTPRINSKHDFYSNWWSWNVEGSRRTTLAYKHRLWTHIRYIDTRICRFSRCWRIFQHCSLLTMQLGDNVHQHMKTTGHLFLCCIMSDLYQDLLYLVFQWDCISDRITWIWVRALRTFQLPIIHWKPRELGKNV